MDSLTAEAAEQRAEAMPFRLTMALNETLKGAGGPTFCRMRIGVKPGQSGWSFDELVAFWRGAEDADFDIVSCLDHVSAAPAVLAAWDAPARLTAMAGVTKRIALAVAGGAAMF